MEAVPGVRSAAVAMCGLEVECRSSGNIKVSGYEPAPREEMRSQYSYVSPGYFSTVGMRLLRGRDFDARDRETRSIIVNESLVRRYFQNRDPLGQRIGFNFEGRIIGVIQDARVNRVREEAVPMMYLPLEGNPIYAGSLEVRAAGDPESIARDVRKELAEAAPDLPIERITPLALQVNRSLSAERLGSILAAVFGILALSLACLGLYGVMSYAVSRRTPEIGIRVALGARPAGILGGVLKDALGLLGLGLAVGLPAAIFISRSIAGLLYGLAPTDPLTLVTTIFLLSGIATFASLIPAWRASRVNPTVALRQE
jgi:predicted permease